MAFDFESLTLGDLADLEDVAGFGLADLQAVSANGTLPPTKVLIGLVWVMRRQTEPDYTLDDARRVPFGQLEELMGDLFGGDLDPEA